MNKQYIKGIVSKTADGKYKVLASTSAIDRQGDTIDQSGWDLTNFKVNPVMLWAHNYSELPIAKVLDINTTQLGLEADFEFAPTEGNPKAQQVKVLYDNGYLNAVSVGFIPKERNGNNITKAELLEISFVPVPANQEALRLAMKSLDDGNTEVKEALEFMLKAMDEMKKGEVADELSREEMWELKYQKFNEVGEVISALWSVYFNEETPVEDFGKLLTESISLLQEVVDTDGVDADDEEEMTDNDGEVAKTIKTMTVLEKKEYIDFISKSGKKLSKDTLSNIEKAITSMKDATTVLEALKASSDEVQDGKGDSESESTQGNEEKSVELKLESSDDLKIIRRTLINKGKENELALSVVNAHLKAKGIVI